jgi:hypothetical protein
MLHPARQLQATEFERKPLRARLAELVSGMLLAAILSVIAAVLAVGLMGVKRIEECALLAGTALLGCWSVLIPSKLWEGRTGDPMLRRLTMAVLGLGVGLWSGYLDQILQAGLAEQPASRTLLEAPPWLPKILADASYFALVFFTTSWWLLVDSRRELRFNPWAVLTTCFWAFLVSRVWSYPQPWGIVVAAMVVLLVQVASPWEDPARRRRTV